MNTQSGTSDEGLPGRLSQRRTELRIGKAEAARRAGVGRMTWWEWEAGRRQPYDANYAGIEEAMQWEPGSVEAAINERTPTPLSAPPSDNVRAPEVSPTADPSWPHVDPRTGTIGDVRRGLAYFHLRFKDTPEDYDRLLALLDLAVHLELAATDTQSSTQLDAHG